MGAPGCRVIVGASMVASLAAAIANPALAGPNRWTTTGPEGGIVRAAAVAPTDPDLVLVGTEGGGIFKSVDAGSTWSATRGLHTDAVIWHVAFAPTDASVAYAATDSGAYRSANGGGTWTLIYSESTTTSVTVDPTDADVAFITASLTVYRTDDGGGSWTEIEGPHGFLGADEIVFARSDPDIAFAASASLVYRSADAGMTWEIVSSPQSHILDLAIHPTDENVLLLGTFGFGVWRSADGGASWDATTGIPRFAGSSQFPPVWDVEYDPSHPGRVLAAVDQRGLAYRSTDGGVSWTSRVIGIGYSPRVIAIASDDGSPAFLGTNDGGVVRSTDGGVSWTAANRGLVGSEVTALVVQSGTSGTVVAATGGQGIFRTTDGGASWVASGLGTRRLLTLSGSPVSPGLFYAGGDDGLWRSRDGGRTWSRVKSFPVRGVVAVAIAPSDPRRVYVVQFEYSWRSIDGGATWTRMSLRGNFGSVAVHPRRPQVVLVGSRTGVYRSDDSGATWQRAAITLHRDIHNIVIDPSRPRLMYAALDVDGVGRSRDGGRTWQYMRTGLDSWRIRGLAIDPSNPDRVYAGTVPVGALGGVYVSINRGGTWTRMSAGLTTTWTESFAVSANGMRLYAGTSAGGAGGGGAFGFVRR